MKKLRSVCIIERVDQKVPAVYLKEFFMFAGVYVYIHESIADIAEISEIKNRENHEVNVYIDLTGSQNGSERLDDSTVYIKLLVDADKQLNTPESRHDFGSEIFTVIWQELKKFMQDEDEIWGFKSLSDIFVENDYAHEHFLSHLYLKQMPDDRKKKLSEFYLGCFKEIYKELIEKNTQSLNLTFAYLNCARKMNRIDMSCNRQTLFDEIKVMKTAHKLSEIDSSFTIADVLAGQIAFSRSSIWSEGQHYLREALQREKRKKYSSFVYYCIGHFYEVEQNDLDRAEEFYNYIKEFDSENYRMNFKLGWIRYCRSEYNEAWNYFYKVYKQMSAKKDTGWIQPLEMEYLYKCALILSESEALKNTHMGQTVLKNDILDIKNTVFDNSLFISAFLSPEEILMYKECYVRKMEDHNHSLIID